MAKNNWNNSPKKNLPSDMPSLKYNSREINKDIPIEEVMSRYAGSTMQRNKKFHCPNPQHPDKNPSATVNHDRNTCRCWSCATTFTPITVVMQNCDLPFLQACERLVEDFGLDKYRYSNLAEVEEYWKPASERKFIDSWYLENSEIENIGLIPNAQFKVTLDADEYFKVVCGDVPMEGKDGGTISVSFEEAAKYDFLPQSFANEENQKGFSLRQMWLDGNWEDKISIEDMIIGKCDETFLNNKKNKEFMEQKVASYDASYSPDLQNRLKELCMEYIERGLERVENGSDISLPAVKSPKVERAMAETMQVYNYREILRSGYFEARNEKAEATYKKVMGRRAEREKDMKKHPQNYRSTVEEPTKNTDGRDDI